MTILALVAGAAINLHPSEAERLHADLQSDQMTTYLSETGHGRQAVSAPRSSILYRDIPYDISAPHPNPLKKLDIFRPAGRTDCPVMIMIHGGAWQIGDKSHPSVGCEKADFFNRQGFVLVTINYRLSPQVVHPAHVTDVAEAIAWVHANIKKYGGDPGRIYLIGHSAGAHLAALVSTDERYLRSRGLGLDTIRGTILLDGAGYDMPALLRSRFRQPALRSMYLTAFGPDTAVWQDASPVYHVQAGKHIPPFLITYAASRPNSSLSSEEFASTLRRAGVDAQTLSVPGKTHRDMNCDVGRPGDILTKAISGFLSAASGGPGQ